MNHPRKLTKCPRKFFFHERENIPNGAFARSSSGILRDDGSLPGRNESQAASEADPPTAGATATRLRLRPPSANKDLWCASSRTHVGLDLLNVIYNYAGYYIEYIEKLTVAHVSMIAAVWSCCYYALGSFFVAQIYCLLCDLLKNIVSTKYIDVVCNDI